MISVPVVEMTLIKHERTKYLPKAKNIVCIGIIFFHTLSARGNRTKILGKYQILVRILSKAVYAY